MRYRSFLVVDFRTLAIASLSAFLGVFSALAQVPPILSTPVPAPAPAIGPPIDLTDLRAASTPTAQVTVKSLVSSLPVLLASLTPAAHGGVFDAISIVPPSVSFASTLVNVRLQFNVSKAGAFVAIQLLDGGILLSADGKDAAGGALFELDGAGAVAFSFRPPSRSDRYQVAIRLGNVETILPVDVLPAASPQPTPVPAGAPAPLPSPSLG